MATIPDTPDIADALEALNLAGLSLVSVPAVGAAVARLRQLHQLGGTEEGVAAGLRRQLADATAAFATASSDLTTATVEVSALKTERDALKARLAAQAPTDGVPATEFRKRLLPLRLRLLTKSEAVRAKWGVILPELDYFTTVFPRDEPVAGLILLAIQDELISAAEADQLRA